MFIFSSRCLLRLGTQLPQGCLWVAAATSVISSNVSADAVWPPIDASVGFSHTADAREGVSLTTGWRFNADWRLKVRFERNFHERAHNVSLVQFNESFKRNSISLLVERDIEAFPALSVAAGVVHFDTGSEWTANPTVSAIYELNNTYYYGSHLGSPEATINYNKLVPYLGLSWSSLRSNQTGWGLVAEAGFMFNLKPTLTLRSENPSDLVSLNADLQYAVDAYIKRLESSGAFLDNVVPRIGVAAIYQF